MTADEARRRPPIALLIAPLLGFFGLAMLGTAFAPSLLVEEPLALVALNPVLRHLVMTANQIEPLPFYTVALLRLLGPDPFHYLLGRLYGDSALVWIESRSPRAGRMVRWLERAFKRAGLVLLFIAPEGVICILAGAARVRPATFLVLNVLGTIGMLTLVRLFGTAFAGPIETAIEFVRANVLALTAISIAIVVIGAWRRRRTAIDDQASSLPP